MPGRKPLRRLAAVVAIATSAACALPASAEPVAPAGERPASVIDRVWHGAQDLVFYALGMVGIEYRYGGEDPASGLDCSGLVRHVFQQVAGVTLPRTALEMSRVGDRVGKGELRPGDLVFFNTRRFAFSHVGIYLGDGRFVHAPRTGRDVEVAQFDNRYWQKRFDGARRLAGVLPALVSSAEAAPLAPAAAADQP
ncbi:MAG: C40 family peptidase [Betaproteobacteria bacterium]|nr:C40 family peptidase [Betaproteobacteria bacterium]MDH5286535.1 C40 family peptidase [Betaproteobacteria bacterium]